MLHHLGTLSDAGHLISGNQTIGRAEYDFQAFPPARGRSTANDGIGMSAGVSKDMPGHGGFVEGELPTGSDWRD